MVKKDRNGLEAVLTTGEAVVDVVMNGDLITSIPIIGLAWKFSKASDDLRARLFTAKIYRFMTGLGEVPDAEKERMRAMLAEREELQKIGEIVLLTLEQVNDLDKANMMGSLFRLYIDGQITGENLSRLTNAINLAFWSDLSEFIWGHCDSSCQTRLVTAGLYSSSGVGVQVGDYTVVGLTITPLGQVLLGLRAALPQP